MTNKQEMQNGTTTSRFLLPVKLIITAAFITIIIKNVDWAKILDVLQQVNLLLIYVVIFLMLVNVLVSSLKWKILLSIHHAFFHFKDLSRFYFIAIFFNNFLPTSIGGDGYRIYKTYANTSSKSGAIAAVLAERVTGFLALLIYGLIGGIISIWYHPDNFSRLAILMGIVGVIIGLILFLIAFQFIKIDYLIKSKFIPRKIKNIFECIYDFKRAPTRTLQIVLLSFLFHFIFISNRFLLLRSIDAYIAVYDLIVVTMISTLLALVPITINGIGLLEGSAILLFVHFGVVYDQAVALMLLIRTLQICLSLFGGILYFIEKRSAKIKPDLKAEEVKSISYLDT